MTIGIICEYNPFHYGHLYHIKKIKEMYPNSTIVLVMSSNFTQRGELSIINKWDKTKIALHYGIDLVVELPFKYASQSADIFAKGAINILKHLKVDKLVFGSESNDIDTLINLANIQLNNKKYDKLVKQYLDKGYNYPTAMNKSLNKLTNKNITEPNDLLGLSYIKEIIKQKTNIEPITIKRTNNYHSTKLQKISSATSIREAIKLNKDINKYLPSYVIPFINKKLFLDNYFDLIKYKIISTNNLTIYQGIDEGIENRLKKYILTSYTLEEYIQK
jgi:predicted nucleotidyltransferase